MAGVPAIIPATAGGTLAAADMAVAVAATDRLNFQKPCGKYEDSSYEVDAFWSRYINPNFSTLLGYRFINEEDTEDRFIGGIRYRLPRLLWTSLPPPRHCSHLAWVVQAEICRLQRFFKALYNGHLPRHWETSSGSMGTPVSLNHEGQEVKLCCRPCFAKFKADPQRYLSKL